MSTDTPSDIPATEDRTVTILAYITVIGFIVAIVIHSGKKTRLGAYHLRQMLGLVLAGLALGVIGGVLAIVPFLGWLAAFVLWIGLLVLWVMGLVAAVNGQFKPVPVLGDHFQKWFGNAFE